ncbi:class I SAM-dependent methyltransferase [Streptomyces sp. NPDC054796]
MIRQELVARQLDEQIAARFEVGRRLRVLDVGLGRGEQSLRLARAGHKVTGLESDPALLALVREALEAEPEGIRQRVRVVPGDSQDTGATFLPGTFDVVLCHGELMEARDPGNTLAGLARVLDTGGLLSLLIRNDDALAMHPGRAGDWDAVVAALDFAERAEVAGSGSGQAFRREALTATLAGIGTPLHEWYGVQVFATDEREGGGALSEEDERIVTAELRAGRTDPYRSVAAMLHLCGVRG